MAAAFQGSDPMLALNSRRTDTERNEQTGIANLMKGCFSAFRNPTAHEPKVTWHVSEADALDLLGTLSLIHRRLEGWSRATRAANEPSRRRLGDGADRSRRPVFAGPW